MKSGMPWVKLWTDFIHDDKLAEVGRSARLRFVELLCLAGECDADGVLVNGEEPLSAARIAFRLHDAPAQVKADIDVLHRAGVLTIKDGAISITNWDARQGEKWAEIKAKWRARQARHRNVTRDSRVSHASVTQMSRTEKEKRIEKKRDTAVAVSPAPASAPIAVPDSMRTQKAPPRAKAGHLAWPKVAAFMRGMNLQHVTAERAAAIEEACFSVAIEDVEKRALEWLTRYGKPVKAETWEKAIDVAANGWAERKAIPAPAVFQPPPTRKGAKPQVFYTDEMRKAADERAAAQLAEREARLAAQGDTTS